MIRAVLAIVAWHDFQDVGLAILDDHRISYSLEVARVMVGWGYIRTPRSACCYSALFLGPVPDGASSYTMTSTISSRHFPTHRLEVITVSQ